MRTIKQKNLVNLSENKNHLNIKMEFNIKVNG